MKIFNYIKGTTMACLMVVLCTACGDFLETPPLNKLSAEVWYQNETQVQMAVFDCYKYLPEADDIMQRDSWTDNMAHRSGHKSAFGNGSLKADNRDLRGMWRYDAIANINLVLEALPEAPVSDAFKKQAACELRFIRAYVYYDMLFFFGDVPLITKRLTFEESLEQTRQPRAEVLKFVLDELKAVAAGIGSANAGDPSRINEDVVNAYLARVCLYEKQYKDALAYINKVDAKGTYGLFDPHAGDPSKSSYDALFRVENDGKTNEVIFERQYGFPLYTHKNNKYHAYPSARMHGWLHNMPLNNLVEEYECACGQPVGQCAADCPHEAIRKAAEAEGKEGTYLGRDPRLHATVVYPNHEWIVDGEVWSTYGYRDANSKDHWKNEPTSIGYLMYKWLELKGDETNRNASGKNATIIRYGDLLLMKAEILVEDGGDLNEVAAILNQIRKRAGMPENITAKGRAEMRSLVRHERRIETALEGLRYYDIVRWRICDKVKNGTYYGAKREKPDGTLEEQNVFVSNAEWEDYMYLLPIPQEVLDRNEKITPNPGW